jgi:hypothetical protein
MDKIDDVGNLREPLAEWYPCEDLSNRAGLSLVLSTTRVATFASADAAFPCDSTGRALKRPVRLGVSDLQVRNCYSLSRSLHLFPAG